jgi:hypothetical protein
MINSKITTIKTKTTNRDLKAGTETIIEECKVIEEPFEDIYSTNKERHILKILFDFLHQKKVIYIKDIDDLKKYLIEHNDSELSTRKLSLKIFNVFKTIVSRYNPPSRYYIPRYIFEIGIRFIIDNITLAEYLLANTITNFWFLAKDNNYSKSYEYLYMQNYYMLNTTKQKRIMKDLNKIKRYCNDKTNKSINKLTVLY